MGHSRQVSLLQGTEEIGLALSFSYIQEHTYITCIYVYTLTCVDIIFLLCFVTVISAFIFSGTDTGS